MKKAKLTSLDEMILNRNLLTGEKRRILKIIESHQGQLQKVNQQIATLTTHIENSTPKEAVKKKVGISCHAYERFKERIGDCPRKVIRAEMNKSGVQERYEAMGNGKYAFGPKNSFVAVIQDFEVVTFYDLHSIESRLKWMPEYLSYWVNMRAVQLRGVAGITIMEYDEWAENLWQRLGIRKNAA